MKVVGIGVLMAATSAFGSVHKFEGSDTLAGVMTDAIIAAGLNQEVQYVGGGSGKGEKALLNGTQAIAPMSREIDPAAVKALGTKNVTVKEHVVALDGLSVFVNHTNPLRTSDLATVAKIFTCQITKWDDVPGSNKTGPIKVYRRNDSSGTTDAFKHFTGVKAFGTCVTAVEETADIAYHTENEANSVGYAGQAAKRDKNRQLTLARKAGDTAYAPTVANIRSFLYPMSRRLYVYELSGAVQPNSVEARFMGFVTDRTFLDPIVQSNEFFTID